MLIISVGNFIKTIKLNGRYLRKKKYIEDQSQYKVFIQGDQGQQNKTYGIKRSVLGI